MENRPCLIEEESAFAYEKDDLVTLRPGRNHSVVDGFVERMLQLYCCQPIKIIGSSDPSGVGKSADDSQYLFCSKVHISPDHASGLQEKRSERLIV